MQENYAESLRRVLAHEGGYTDHPSDPGGPTNWGITIHDARMHWKRDATSEDVRAMPRDVAKRIYKSKYWDAMRCDELPPGVDYAVFDFGVNSGISRSIKFLERIVGVPEDGKADDVLIRTLANMPPKPVVIELCNKRLVFLKGLRTWDVFGRGWGRRVEEVKSGALLMADNKPLPAPDARKSANGKAGRPDAAQPIPHPAPSAAAGGVAAIVAALAGYWWLAALVLAAGVAAGIYFYMKRKD